MKRRFNTVNYSNGECRVRYTKQRRKKCNNILLRYVSAALIFVSLFLISKLDFSVCKKISETIKTAIIYDINSKSESAGEIPALKEYFKQNENETETED